MRPTVPLALLLAIPALPVELPAQARRPLLLAEDAPYPVTGTYLGILEEDAAQLSFEAVRSGRRADFATTDDPSPVIGRYDGNVWVSWLHFEVENRAPRRRRWVLEVGYPLVDEVQLYTEIEDGGDIAVRRAGNRLPFSARELPHRKPSFALDLPAGATAEVYLRISNRLPFHPGLVLQPAIRFQERSQRGALAYGLFYGLMGVMATYNLVLGAFLRDRSHLNVAGFVLAYALLIAISSGHAKQYLWPDRTWSNLHTLALADILQSLCILFFTMRFLQTRSRSPRWHRLLLVVAFAFTVLLLLVPFIELPPILTSWDLLQSLYEPSVLGAGLLGWRSGYRPARYFVVAVSVPIAASIAALFVEAPELSSRLEAATLLGVCAFVVLLSLALADRVRLLQAEREAALVQVRGAKEGLERANQLLRQEVASRRAAEDRQLELIEDLESKNAELESFNYTVSHDLKSPLVTIKGFAGHLERDLAAVADDRIRGDLARIRGAADRMHELLEALLTLSRLRTESGSQRAIPFRQVAEEAIELVAGRIRERRVRVVLDPQLPEVEADPTRLRLALQNLIDNAVKFMGDQTQPEIRIGAERTARETVFFVRDNGIGIERPYQERIFGIFDRLDSTVEGTGIGLALVKRVVKLHGGRVWVESEGRGTGSRFCFTLRGATSPAHGDPSPAPPLSSSASDGRSPPRADEAAEGREA